MRNNPVSTKVREGEGGGDVPGVEQGKTPVEQMDIPKGLQPVRTPCWIRGKNMRGKERYRETTMY